LLPKKVVDDLSSAGHAYTLLSSTLRSAMIWSRDLCQVLATSSYVRVTALGGSFGRAGLATAGRDDLAADLSLLAEALSFLLQ
jgi:hypothetical protein